MAQNFMSNPDSMRQMQDMMQNPDFMNNLQGMMGGNPNLANLASQFGNADPDTLSKMTAMMKDDVKRTEVMNKVYNDPDMAALKADPEIGPCLERLKAQDMSALTELMAKPEAFGKIQKVIQKHLD